MLRHIISVSLAMTACASLIPIKANAATFTLEPVGTLERNIDDSIAFVLKVNPNPFPGGLDEVEIRNITLVDYDKNELKNDRIVDVVRFNTSFSQARAIATFIFDVRRPVKDGNGDLITRVDYRVRTGGVYQSRPPQINSGPFYDVQPVSEPVPEPLTMLGAAAALGYGVILKRKSSKKIIS